MKKKSNRTPSCGRSNTQASPAFSKCDCFSPRSSRRPPDLVSTRAASDGRFGSAAPSSAAASLAAGIHLLELTKNLVSARHRIVDGLLDRLLTEQARQDFVLDGDVCLRTVAEPETARIVVGRPAVELLHRNLARGMVLVVALRLRRLISGMRDRHVAGRLMPPDLRVGLGKEIVKRRDRLVVLARFAFERPEGRAADRAVLLRTVRLDGKQGRAPFELGPGLDRGMRRRRVDDGRALAADEELPGIDALAGKLQDAVVEPLLDAPHVTDKLGLVEHVLGVEPLEAVLLRRVGLILD